MRNDTGIIQLRDHPVRNVAPALAGPPRQKHDIRELQRVTQPLAQGFDIVMGDTKPHGLAVHYRLAAEREAEVWELVRRLVPPDHPWFRLIPAREAVEIGLRAASKGDAVERLMAHAPFHGRKPIFIGDDFTDEAGMSMARRFGGLGLRVAEVFGGDPAQVRAWLTHGMEHMDGRPSPSAAPTGIAP